MTELNGTRIAFVIDSLARGGAELVLLNLIPQLKNLGVDPIVISLFQDETLLDAYRKAGIEVKSLKLRRQWSLRKNSRYLAKCLLEQKIDLIHAHLFFSGIYVGLSRLWGLQSARVISFHGLVYARGNNPRNVSYFIRKTLNFFVLKFAYDRYLAVSSAVAEHYLHHLRLAQPRLSVVGNPIVIPDRLITDSAQAVAVPEDKKKIVALGRLVPEKDYPVLIHAFSELRRTNADVQLEIIGDGPLKAQLQELVVQNGLLDTVILRGPLEHAEAMKLLSGADLFVLSSVHEGFGLVAAEAMLLEVPVVVTRVGGLVDIAKPEFAEIVEPSDSQILAAGIEHVLGLDEGERSRRIAEARKHVEKCFSLSKVAQKHIDIYSEILQAHG